MSILEAMQWFLEFNGCVLWGKLVVINHEVPYLRKKVLLKGLHPIGSSFLEGDKLFFGSVKRVWCFRFQLLAPQ